MISAKHYNELTPLQKSTIDNLIKAMSEHESYFPLTVIYMAGNTHSGLTINKTQSMINDSLKRWIKVRKL